MSYQQPNNELGVKEDVSEIASCFLGYNMWCWLDEAYWQRDAKRVDGVYDASELEPVPPSIWTCCQEWAYSWEEGCKITRHKAAVNQIVKKGPAFRTLKRKADEDFEDFEFPKAKK